MYKPKDTRERIIHRLKITKGHLNKVLAMVEKGCDCSDILFQSQAIQSALKETDYLILQNHLKICEKGKDKEISNLMQVFRRV